jgi:hypothetical protein
MIFKVQGSSRRRLPYAAVTGMRYCGFLEREKDKNFFLGIT